MPIYCVRTTLFSITWHHQFIKAAMSAALVVEIHPHKALYVFADHSSKQAHIN